MSFDKMLKDYRVNVLGEAGEMPPPPAPEGDPGMGAPPPEGGEEEQSAEELAAKATDVLRKAEDRPWVDLAGILCKVILQPPSAEQVAEINNGLPFGLSLSEIANARNSEIIKQMNAPNIVSASMKLYDDVERVISDDGKMEVIPAEER